MYFFLHIFLIYLQVGIWKKRDNRNWRPCRYKLLFWYQFTFPITLKVMTGIALCELTVWHNHMSVLQITQYRELQQLVLSTWPLRLSTFTKRDPDALFYFTPRSRMTGANLVLTSNISYSKRDIKTNLNREDRYYKMESLKIKLFCKHKTQSWR